MQFRQCSIGGTRYVDIDGELCLRAADGSDGAANVPLQNVDVRVYILLVAPHYMYCTHPSRRTPPIDPQAICIACKLIGADQIGTELVDRLSFITSRLAPSRRKCSTRSSPL